MTCENSDRSTTGRVWINLLKVQRKTNVKILIDPLGQPKVMAGRDHCFRTCCPYVRPHFSNLEKTNQSENNVRYWRDYGSGRVDHWWHQSYYEYFYSKMYCVVYFIGVTHIYIERFMDLFLQCVLLKFYVLHKYLELTWLVVPEASQQALRNLMKNTFLSFMLS